MEGALLTLLILLVALEMLRTLICSFFFLSGKMADLCSFVTVFAAFDLFIKC